jgi:hypothetical protein
MTGTLERTQWDFSEPWGSQHTGCWLWLGRFASVRGREPLKLSNSNHPRNSIGTLAIKKPEIFGGFDFFALDQGFEASPNDWNLFHKAPFIQYMLACGGVGEARHGFFASANF